jgi:outer membrane protein TolC
MKTNILLAAIAILPAVADGAPARGAGKMSLHDYLEQVRSANTAYRGALLASEGALGRSHEGAKLVAPTLFASAQLVSDAKQPVSPGFTYDKLRQNGYVVGLSQATRFGLQARLSYNLNYFSYVNAGVPGGTMGINASYYEAHPTLELTQSLWANGFGRATRANLELAEAQALSAGYSNRHLARATRIHAETSYWTLVVRRQNLRLQSDAFERAQKIYDWSARRARLQLADRADELQAKALLELRRLEQQAAVDDVRSAQVQFNVARGIDLPDVPESLPELDASIIDPLSVPERAPMRDDVRAAEQAARATAAGATAAAETDLPTLELFGSYAFNGRDAGAGSATSDAFSSGRPTQAVGVRFSLPLNLGTLSDARRGWAREREGAALAYEHRLLEQEQEWEDLTRRFAEVKQRYKLTLAIERAQAEKLQHEKGRLQRGRTTTYQVLQFEQDYALAQIARIRAESDVLVVYAQLELFGEAT